MIAKFVAQFRKLRSLFLLGGVDRMISVERMDEGNGLTLATDILPQ